MPKKRTREASIVRYKQKAFEIAKGLGLDDKLAREKAEAQTNAWINGRSAYDKLSRYVMDRLILDTTINSVYYGQIISMANWLYKEVAIRKSMDFETAWNVAMEKWGLDKTLGSKNVEDVKAILQKYISPGH